MIGSTFLGIIDRNRHFDGGRGTVTSPYRITKLRHLNNVRKYPTARYIQLNDLIFTDEFKEDGEYYNGGLFWRPIPSFSGDYNGQGYKIEKLKTIFTGNGQGSFVNSVTGTGKIHQIYFRDLSANPGATRRDRCGGVAGNIQINARLEKIFVDGEAPRMGTWCGGLLGGNGTGQVHQCGINMAISTSQVYGGLIGGYSAKIYNSYARGTLTGTNHGGGISGTSYQAYVENSYSTIWMNGGLRRGIISDYDTTGNGEQSGCYFDTQSTNTTNGGRVNATGRTSVQMKWPYDMDNFPVYIGWNFDTIWGHDINGNINNGYPYLRGVTPEQ